MKNSLAKSVDFFEKHYSFEDFKNSNQRLSSKNFSKSLEMAKFAKFSNNYSLRIKLLIESSAS